MDEPDVTAGDRFVDFRFRYVIAVTDPEFERTLRVQR
jgi:hypothetical protein